MCVCDLISILCIISKNCVEPIIGDIANNLNGRFLYAEGSGRFSIVPRHSVQRSEETKNNLFSRLWCHLFS